MCVIRNGVWWRQAPHECSTALPCCSGAKKFRFWAVSPCLWNTQLCRAWRKLGERVLLDIDNVHITVIRNKNKSNTHCSIQIIQHICCRSLQPYDWVYKIEPSIFTAKNIVAKIWNICYGIIVIAIEVLVFFCNTYQPIAFLILCISRALPVISILLRG